LNAHGATVRSPLDETSQSGIGPTSHLSLGQPKAMKESRDIPPD